MGLSPVIWQFLVKWLTNFAIIPPEASKIATQMDELLVFMTLVSLVGLVLVGLLVAGWAVVKLIALPFGGVSNVTAVWAGLLVVIVALVVLTLVGRRRQARARAAARGG